MSQVERTVNELIVHSLYMIGELGVGESPDSFMLSTGLELVNEILDEFAADSIFIPYLTSLDFTMTPQQDTYSISDMVLGSDIVADRVVDLTFANYSVSNIVYPLRIVDKAVYYGIVRQTGFYTRPAIVFLNQQDTVSYVTFYPSPDQAYPCSLKTKSMLNKLTNQDSLSSLPPYFYGFLKFAMARRWRSYYPSSNWPDTNEKQYQLVYQNLTSANETDLVINPSVILNGAEPFYWQTILAY